MQAGNSNDAGFTGVCKINGVVIVVNCCFSIGFFKQQTATKTPFFFKHGYHGKRLAMAG